MKRLLLALALLACKSGDEPAPLAENCTYASTNASCAACAQSSCCEALTACDDDPECRPYVECTARCSADAACATQCRTARPKGALRSAAVDSCLASRCAKPCGMACGGYVGPTPGCTTCIESKCCAEAAACQSDAQCAALIACEKTCVAVDAVCLGRCERAFPSATAAARAFGVCVDASCESSCLPPRWRCLDSPPPAPLTVARETLTATLRMTSVIDGRAWPNLSIRACRQGDPACAAPLAGPTLTDENGHAALVLPGPVFEGYFEITGSGAMPLLWFHEPISTDVVRGYGAFDKSVFDLFTGTVATARDDRGHMLMTAHDCNRHNAAGVSFEIEPRDDAVVGYLISGSLSTTARETAPGGTGGFLNVRPNAGITITPRVRAFDRALPSRTVFTRPGWVSAVEIQAY